MIGPRRCCWLSNGCVRSQPPTRRCINQMREEQKMLEILRKRRDGNHKSSQYWLVYHCSIRDMEMCEISLSLIRYLREIKSRVLNAVSHGVQWLNVTISSWNSSKLRFMWQSLMKIMIIVLVGNKWDNNTSGPRSDGKHFSKQERYTFETTLH